ncbi:HD-GYP domain-containing protein [Desulfosporosinus metallidurans]|uniref:HD-hydrolase domain n=1 Tax=Desulfosporosinus metallidurans TaxID=1888891 RepID=A0A1Q8QMX4_9FIRM|nr:HD-GYP domain-containing protein [Desulfosporosinus metallidurans]OLN28679.1 HD-hydrolase domain [Desulfosporosinus metallidurans]
MNLVFEKLPPGFLVLGNHVHVDLFDASGLLLLTRGQLMTKRIWERLVRKEVYTLKAERNPVIPTVNNNKSFSKDLYWNIVGSIWSIYHEAKLITTQQISQTMVSIECIINEIKDKSIYMDFNSLQIDMVRFKEHDYCTFIHSVNVAILATLTARELGYKGRRLRYLTMGAILHDLGKLKVPCEILNKSEPLTESELNLIKQHPIEGEAMLRNADVLPSILRTVRQHHERWDGKGYPDGLSGIKIHLDAQIVAVADVYDALTADRPYRKALPPYHALEIILTVGKDFNPKVVEAFRKSLNLYPEDTIVTLNTGEIGIVVAVPTSFPTRPLVRLLFDSNGRYLNRETYIDLLYELTYFIKSIKCKNGVVV